MHKKSVPMVSEEFFEEVVFLIYFLTPYFPISSLPEIGVFSNLLVKLVGENTDS
ncbi:MAG: hypothetical protein JHD28_04240 [Bacteroidia bacterium]|nr:hypothetical protein [Bacteroidia bacterium]